jgi:hypothetical protein
MDTRRAVAIVTDKPGSAPMITPLKLPRAVSRIMLIFIAFCKAEKNIRPPVNVFSILIPDFQDCQGNI